MGTKMLLQPECLSPGARVQLDYHLRPDAAKNNKTRKEAWILRPAPPVLQIGERLKMELMINHACWWCLHKSPERTWVQRAAGLLTTWRGFFGTAAHLEALCPLPTFLASVVIISFCNTLVNSKERVFLGSVSCSSKLTKHQEGVPMSPLDYQKHR